MHLQRNTEILWQYYIDVSLYNLAVSILVSLYTHPFWGMLIYGTFGYLIALGCYQYFQGVTYVFYCNWGWTKSRLIFRLWIFNFLLLLFIAVIYLGIAWLI
ncbi:MAG: hypothetical protein KTR30_17235 [Saprospiraceae bacterium]|nr:hypothetical protein [Saprospiraceae bacterium]